MWRITWRDLVFRRRRFVIAAVSTALVLAITVLMSGLIVAVDNQNARAATVVRTDLRTFRTRQGHPPEPRPAPVRRSRRAPLRVG